MFGDKGNNKRLAKQAKAIERKAQRNGGEIRGRDAARLTRVKGTIVKRSWDDEEQENEGRYN